MITYWILHTALSFIALPVGLMPIVSLLPLGIDSTVSTYVNYWFAFMGVFWPLVPIWNCLLIYLPFKLTMLLLKVIMGSRVPAFSV